MWLHSSDRSARIMTPTADPSSAATLCRGKIIEWNSTKNFGFIDDGQRRVFAHIREFKDRHKMPEPGDSLTFTLGADNQGRPCAKDIRQVGYGGPFVWFTSSSSPRSWSGPAWRSGDWPDPKMPAGSGDGSGWHPPSPSRSTRGTNGAPPDRNHESPKTSFISGN